MIGRYANMINAIEEQQRGNQALHTRAGGAAHILSEAMKGFARGRDNTQRDEAQKALAAFFGGLAGDTGGDPAGAMGPQGASLDSMAGGGIPGAGPGGQQGFQLPSQMIKSSMPQPQQSIGMGMAAAPPSVFPQAGNDDPIYGAIEQQESGGNPNAVSPVGARGLMQVMPATAMDPGYGQQNIFDYAAQRNIPVAARDEATAKQLLMNGDLNTSFGRDYFDKMKGHFGGSNVLALAAYNAGAGNVNSWLKSIGDPRTGQISEQEFISRIPFAETRDYVTKITNNIGGDFTGTPAQTTRPGSFQLPSQQLRAGMPQAGSFMSPQGQFNGQEADRQRIEARNRGQHGDTTYQGAAGLIDQQSAQQFQGHAPGQDQYIVPPQGAGGIGGQPQGGQPQSIGNPQLQLLVKAAEAGNPYAMQALQQIVAVRGQQDAMRQQQEAQQYGRMQDERRFAFEQQKHQDVMSRGEAENFGQPQVMVNPQTGQQELVQVSNRGTVRPVSGYAPAQEDVGSTFGGQGDDVSSKRALSTIAVKVANGTATPIEMNDYNIAYQAMSQPLWKETPEGLVKVREGFDLSAFPAPAGIGQSARDTTPLGGVVRNPEQERQAAEVEQFRTAKEGAYEDAFARADKRIADGTAAGGAVAGGKAALIAGDEMQQQQDYDIITQQVADKILKTDPGVKTDGDALRAAKQMGELRVRDSVERQRVALNNYRRFLAGGSTVDERTAEADRRGEEFRQANRAAAVVPPAGGRMPVVRSDADYDALPSGAQFVDETGVRYTKP